MDKETWDLLQRQVQDRLLTAFPNPARIDCPGVATLRQLAESGATSPVALEKASPLWLWHVVKCSPCYREYLELRRQTKRSTDFSTESPK